MTDKTWEKSVQKKKMWKSLQNKGVKKNGGAKFQTMADD